MNIAIYFDLAAGGASRTMEEIIKVLEVKHRIEVFHNLPNSYNPPFLGRLFRDLESTVLQRFKQRRQAIQIDNEKYDVVFVSHDRHSQAPWILRYLETPSVFLCQEPTRAYFEELFKIDPGLPLLNKLYETIYRQIRKSIEIKNAGFANRIIANSVYSSESLLRAYGLISSPVHLGIDILEYFPESKLKRNQLLVVGNHEPQKALPFAIEVVSKIDKKVRPKLVIASPRDTDSVELKKLAKKLKVETEFLVGLSQHELRKVYCKSKITLAFAYLEPFGLSVIESLACGVPVVAVKEAGFRETVTHERTGLLVERDSSKLATAIQSLLVDNSKLKSMGELGVKEATKNFTWSQTAAQFEKIFTEVSQKHD